MRCYLDELYCDANQTIQLCSSLSTSNKDTDTTQGISVNDSSIESYINSHCLIEYDTFLKFISEIFCDDICNSIKELLPMSAGNISAFELFHGLVEGVIRYHIANCYGKYNKPNDPILSEKEVNYFSTFFNLAEHLSFSMSWVGALFFFSFSRFIKTY